MKAETVERKAAIRKQILEQRARLEAGWVSETSSIIVRLLNAVSEVQTAQMIHCYVSWRNEVDTHCLIKELLQQGKKVVVPVVEKRRRTLTHAQIDAFEELLPGAYGILEPSQDRLKPTPVSDLDLIIVPGVAFDINGNRLGFGGGYYDRFLSECRTFKIGLCYQFQILETIPTEKRDQRVDAVVSEKNLYRVAARI
jgi:5-formyltetrahydrofolate cyclo-ligase